MQFIHSRLQSAYCKISHNKRTGNHVCHDIIIDPDLYAQDVGDLTYYWIRTDKVAMIEKKKKEHIVFYFLIKIWNVYISEIVGIMSCWYNISGRSAFISPVIDVFDVAC